MAHSRRATPSSTAAAVRHHRLCLNVLHSLFRCASSCTCPDRPQSESYNSSPGFFPLCSGHKQRQAPTAAAAPQHGGRQAERWPGRPAEGLHRLADGAQGERTGSLQARAGQLGAPQHVLAAGWMAARPCIGSSLSACCLCFLPPASLLQPTLSTAPNPPRPPFAARRPRTSGVSAMPAFGHQSSQLAWGQAVQRGWPAMLARRDFLQRRAGLLSCAVFQTRCLPKLRKFRTCAPHPSCAGPVANWGFVIAVRGPCSWPQHGRVLAT